MDGAIVKRWLVLFFCILASLMSADQLSNVIIAASGVSGWGRIPAGFIRLTALFCTILQGIRRILMFNFFIPGRHDRRCEIING